MKIYELRLEFSQSLQKNSLQKCSEIFFKKKNGICQIRIRQLDCITLAPE